jgi:hypothetical protein
MPIPGKAWTIRNVNALAFTAPPGAFAGEFRKLLPGFEVAGV